MPRPPDASMGWLVIEHGDRAGERWPINRVSTLIGRDPDDDVVIPETSVSRTHAVLIVSNGTYEIVDNGSSNGTRVNGRTVLGRCELHDKDVVTLAGVHLRLHTSQTPDQAPHKTSTNQRVGDVDGNVNVGTGNQYNAGRDQHNVGQQHNMFSIETDNPLDELFAGVGLGRVIMIVGGLIALGGFAIWTYVILSEGGQEPGPDSGMFNIELVDGVPLGIVGFAMFGVGGIVSEIGRSMSRTKRRR